MAAVWFTSDTHFCHHLVASLRGFTTTEEHDQHVVETWNAHVRPDDVVWHLGDVSMGGPQRFGPYVERLNGTIHLIAGNHDGVHPMHRNATSKQRAWLTHFRSIQTMARRRVNAQSVLLSHFPYTGEGKRDMADRHVQYRLRNEGTALIHGHTHDDTQRLSFDEATPTVHVGWDAWNRPVHIDEVAELLRSGRPTSKEAV